MSPVRLVTTQSGQLQIGVDKNPKASFFTGLRMFDVRAKVCCQCGCVKLFVKDPHELGEFPKEQSG
jgi:hypothetical protein